MSPQRPGYDTISYFGPLLSQNHPKNMSRKAGSRSRKVLAGRQEVGRQEDKQAGMKAGNKAGSF